MGKKDLYRTYRQPHCELFSFRVAVGETDLWVEASWDCRRQVEKAVKFYRRQLRGYIDDYPRFQTTFEPWPNDPLAPEVVQRMITATQRVGVGPMAAVAGAINSMVGESLLSEVTEIPPANRELIIENGGDLFIFAHQTRVVAIYAGDSPFSWKIGLKVSPEIYGLKGINGQFTLGICTSSGTVGPSLSLGRADAAVIVATDVTLADAVATATANRIKSPDDLKKAILYPETIPGVIGALLICGEKMVAWGKIELVNLADNSSPLGSVE